MYELQFSELAWMNSVLVFLQFVPFLFSLNWLCFPFSQLYIYLYIVSTELDMSYVGNRASEEWSDDTVVWQSNVGDYCDLKGTLALGLLGQCLWNNNGRFVGVVLDTHCRRWRRGTPPLLIIEVVQVPELQLNNLSKLGNWKTSESDTWSIPISKMHSLDDVGIRASSAPGADEEQQITNAPRRDASVDRDSLMTVTETTELSTIDEITVEEEFEEGDANSCRTTATLVSSNGCPSLDQDVDVNMAPSGSGGQFGGCGNKPTAPPPSRLTLKLRSISRHCQVNCWRRRRRKLKRHNSWPSSFYYKLKWFKRDILLFGHRITQF